MTNKVRRQTACWLTLLAIYIAFLGSTWAQSPAPGGGGQTREKGIKVKDGDKVDPQPPDDKKAEVPRTIVRFRGFCDALKNAARQPDRKEKKFKNGPIEFWGHEPWIADLICDYINGAVGDAKNPGPFGCKRTPAEEKTIKDLLATEYEARKQFLSKVLAEFEKHSVKKWKEEKWIPSTNNIAADRLLVGRTLLKNLEVSEEQPDKLFPQDSDRFVARSLETPDRVLLGMRAKDFWGPSQDRKLQEGENYLSAGVKAWLTEAEIILLRVHMLAVGASLMFEQNLDYPTPESRMGRTIEQLSHKFQEEYLLRNVGKVTLKETAGDVFEDKAGTDAAPDPAQVRRSAKFVELKINESHVPAKDDRRQNVPGLSLFVYDAMAAGPNRGDWFIKGLALVPSSHASVQGKPGGITLPMWAFRNRGLQALTFADRLFDETTKVPVESRFEASAVCVARIHYSEMGKAALTSKVLAHELKHFEGIRNAWINATTALEQSLRDLAAKLNESLGNLQGPEAFDFRKQELRDVWKLDPKQPDLSAIPVGPLRPEDHASLLHTNQKVSYLRMRLIRRLPAESGAHTLLEMLTSKEQIDPLFNKAQDVIADWKLNHWRNNATNEFRKTFIHEFITAALTLDEKEGTIDDNSGEQSGRKLRSVINKFDALLKEYPNADPLELIKKAY